MKKLFKFLNVSNDLSCLRNDLRNDDSNDLRN